MHAVTAVMTFYNEPIVTTKEELELIRGGTKLTIVSCTLSMPIEFVLVVIVSTPVEELEKPITPKLVPLIIPKIGLGVEITLLDIITHASKVIRTPDIVLKDTHVVESPGFESIPLFKHVDTIGKHVDELIIIVKHVVLGD
jgi:hypothetical protein